MRNVKKLSLCVVMLVLLASATSVAVEYEIVDLGAMGGSGSYARGINDSGQVVGHSTTNSGLTHAFLWTESGGMQDLGTLGGYYVYAYGINDLGQVVGISRTVSGQSHAFLWTAEGGMQDLGTLPLPDGSFSYSNAYGINNLGQVVGESSTASGWNHAFLWTEEGGMQDLGTLGGESSYARGINDLGQVVGISRTVSGPVAPSHAFLWTDGVMQDLGTLGGSSSYARGINDLGQVVGESKTASGSQHAFLWTDGVMQDLGTLGGSYSFAYGINDSGQVVGYSWTASNLFHAFLWTDGVMQDLGTLGGISSYAYGINDSGQVAGYSYTYSDEPHACMWIPATPCTPVSIDSLTADPLVLPLGNVVNFEATIVDGCGEIDALWDFDDGTVEPQTNVTSPVTTTKIYTSAGVYTMVLTVSDNIVDVGDNIMVVVYDPTGGFVTGGGWIYSPAGAYTPDPSLTGKANFGFVSKYKKGTSVPTGNTEFVFKAGDLNFHSMSYDWLVVTGSNYARFKGWGSINGYGDYRFMLWAGDDDPDTFRIKIWTEDEEGNETIIYDNGFDQGIMGGNIIIHT